MNTKIKKQLYNIIIVSCILFLAASGVVSQAAAANGKKASTKKFQEKFLKSTYIKKIKTKKVKGIAVGSVSGDDRANTMNVQWKKIQGADGYQVQIIDDERYQKGLISVIYKGTAHKKHHLVMKCPNAYYYDMFNVRIRAFVKTKSGKIYGKWTVEGSYAAMFNDN